MKITKKLARTIILPICISLKIDKILLNLSSRRACIINFHGVRKDGTVPINNRHLEVSEFEKIIKYLSTQFKIVTIKEIFEIHRTKKRPQKKTVALTFDDGYLNNFELALPILKKYEVPATFYIITKSLVDPHFLAWPDKIDLIKRYSKKDIQVNKHIFSYPAYVDTTLGLSVTDYLKNCGQNTETLADKLLSENPDAKSEIQKVPELLVLVDEEKMQKYKDEPLIEFGSHSHSHPNLEFLDKKTAETELKTSKELLEFKTGRKVISVAFPDGSYNSETLRISKELGYTDICAVDYRHNEKNSNPDLLSRFTISNSTTFESNVLRLAKDFDKFGFA